MNRPPSAVQQPYRADWLAGAFLVGLFLTGLLADHGDDLWLRVSGLVFLAISLPFIIAPFFLLPRHGSVARGGNYMQTSRVVDRGVYAVARHPQYLGYSLLAAGFLLLCQNRWSTILGGTAMALFYLFSVQEEKHLHSRLGRDYTEYCRRVPRFNVLLGLYRRFRHPPAAAADDSRHTRTGED